MRLSSRNRRNFGERRSRDVVAKISLLRSQHPVIIIVRLIASLYLVNTERSEVGVLSNSLRKILLGGMSHSEKERSRMCVMVGATHVASGFRLNYAHPMSFGNAAYLNDVTLGFIHFVAL